MRYADLSKCECWNGPGWGVTFAVQGCPIRCPGCFNPESWDFEGGKEFTSDIIKEMLEALSQPYISRLSIQGGEPLAPENIFLTSLICKTVREQMPGIKIYIWSGYTVDELKGMGGKIDQFLDGTYADTLVVGPYIQEQRDITLFMRGSKNQEILETPIC